MTNAFQSNALQDLSNSLAQAVANASASVVRVNGRRRYPASGIVWSADGTIITANHVVRTKREITVGLPNGETVTASVVGRDPSTDVAVLKVEAEGLTPAGWNTTPQVGHIALALGRPGHTTQATWGIVSAVGSEWRTPAGGKIDPYLQTDVLMYPGFSGGPLVGADGQFFGLNTSSLRQGTSVAVPAATLERVVGALLTHGEIKRGYLGISTQPVRLPSNIREEVGQKTGLLIVGVEPDSPAEKSGLLLGDTITTLDGKSIRSHSDLASQLASDRADTKVPVDVVRGGEVRTLNVTIGTK